MISTLYNFTPVTMRVTISKSFIYQKLELKSLPPCFFVKDYLSHGVLSSPGASSPGSRIPAPLQAPCPPRWESHPSPSPGSLLSSLLAAVIWALGAALLVSLVSFQQIFWFTSSFCYSLFSQLPDERNMGNKFSESVSENVF